MNEETVHTGECVGGPLDGSFYTERGYSFPVDMLTPLTTRQRMEQPPGIGAVPVAYTSGFYRWGMDDNRWRWAGSAHKDSP
jgi:hypothetical protein